MSESFMSWLKRKYPRTWRELTDEYARDVERGF